MVVPPHIPLCWLAKNRLLFVFSRKVFSRSETFAASAPSLTSGANSVSNHSDAIIAALGALPWHPAIPGLDNEKVLNAVQAYANPDALGDEVTILGGGLAGSELAIYLSILDKKCKVVEMLPELNDGGNILQGLSINIQFGMKGVETHFGTKVLSVDADAGKVIAEEDGKQIELAAPTIVTAMGMRALRDETNELAKCAKEFYAIGDCTKARNIKAATSEAYQAALDLGRL